MNYNALTVEILMQNTSMTRSSFYHYFSGLDDLMVNLLSGFEQNVRDSVEGWLKGEVDDADYRQNAKTYLTAMYEAIEMQRTTMAAILQTANSGSQVYQQWRERVLEYFIELTEAFIRREVNQGRSSVADPARLANALILMNNAVSNENLQSVQPDPPDILASVISDIWNAAIYGGT